MFQCLAFVKLENFFHSTSTLDIELENFFHFISICLAEASPIYGLRSRINRQLNNGERNVLRRCLILVPVYVWETVYHFWNKCP